MTGERDHKFYKSCVDLIEEATHALRTAPTQALAIYYSGAVPFVLGFLYFWADMSRSPYANQHLAEASLGIAVLFVWMKFCQALFAARLRAQLAEDESPRYTTREYGRILFAQAVIQPVGLFILPLALIIAMPFGWAYAFYQNVTALVFVADCRISSLARKAWHQAIFWPLQNHAALGIAILLAGCVFLNWTVVALSIPALLKMLFGVETDFTRHPMSLLNTTFLVAMCGLTYLTLDPLLKTIYVLRCFYGESTQSGEDLKSELKRFASPLRRFAAAILVSSSELDRRIDNVIHTSKYAWRMPRDAVKEEARDSMLTSFVYRVGMMLRDILRIVLRWIDRFLDSLFGQSSAAIRHGFSWSSSSLLLYALLAVALAGLGVFVYRLRRSRNGPVVTKAVPLQSAPDIRDEGVSADQLPEEGWAKMGRDLLDRGEFRLAMRAFYLATLVHLAERNLISIARFKSNRDYENELRRRGHAIPELLSAFMDNVSAVERIWYGVHDINEDVVRQFASNMDKIRSAV
jgi:hypothetical protein